MTLQSISDDGTPQEFLESCQSLVYFSTIQGIHWVKDTLGKGYVNIPARGYASRKTPESSFFHVWQKTFKEGDGKQVICQKMACHFAWL